ncbi:PepSY domain-containing protein [Minwuia thermotolerans]|uniref:PepSY domain-containing protein n=1 Tax=Minwuia thermotolerans TaxID=2056226 RepID=A0A2M9G6U4_9PROT|nr:PepSY domain-containing protein [Minwuia thermotolerans]PJK31435.1 hypothetical protein CVT23_01810 [Minwuia thermotolerans]
MKAMIMLALTAPILIAAPAMASDRQGDDRGVRAEYGDHERREYRERDREHETRGDRDDERRNDQEDGDEGYRRSEAEARVFDDDLARRLTDEGYRIVRMEREHGRVEIRAIRDGRHYEIDVDGVDGRVLRVREDD